MLLLLLLLLLLLYFVLLLASSRVHHFLNGLTRPDKFASDERTSSDMYVHCLVINCVEMCL